MGFFAVDATNPGPPQKCIAPAGAHVFQEAVPNRRWRAPESGFADADSSGRQLLPCAHANAAQLAANPLPALVETGQEVAGTASGSLRQDAAPAIRGSRFLAESHHANGPISAVRELKTDSAGACVQDEYRVRCRANCKNCRRIHRFAL